jgi:hypothetical protein
VTARARSVEECGSCRAICFRHCGSRWAAWRATVAGLGGVCDGGSRGAAGGRGERVGGVKRGGRETGAVEVKGGQRQVTQGEGDHLWIDSLTGRLQLPAHTTDAQNISSDNC